MKTRRDFIKFITATTSHFTLGALVTSCASFNPKFKLPFTPISPHLTDDLVLASGFKYDLLISWQDSINNRGQKFGFNNDFISLLPNGVDSYLMWVNHEYVNPIFVSNYFEENGINKTKNQIAIEKKNVGGSLLNIKKINNKWSVNLSGIESHRIDGLTKIPFSPKQKINNKAYAVGTFANCAGGKTSWGTFLTCEENYQNFVGDNIFANKKINFKSSLSKKTSWEAHDKLDPEHYGWVVEYSPKTKSAKKLVSLGRFAHECATTVLAADGRTVVYMADDKVNEHIYKFISDKPGSLDAGRLYVANIEKGLWLELSYERESLIQSEFKNQQEVLINTRVAAKLVNATPLDRPEDIEIHPHTSEVFIAQTNNKPKGNFHGSILKLVEKNSDHLSLEFNTEVFMLGGEPGGLSCPDNLVFDKKGNLWVTSDISGKSVGKGVYQDFGNNGLFCIPTQGKYVGRVIQIASAPVEAEFTGPCFSDDYKNLFLSVQHPGEKTKNLKDLHSNWPHKDKQAVPKPSVVCISGPSLDILMT